ncbi:polysaccharide biosynthesis tyrosine autokinase [Pseudonocardia cypriaca]|uniref:Capsular exopolysaccharide synthesis family protein n=1 Tax=Pseudonocardia cypriaca TaxID=882449 RepID=A0A543GAK2_9PSEU|nr:polysaccharide biosynthesis tyrosine autokinase [Pseudonocardia cypriaca]TQM43120.1 capsular exopolysaccharide synthesis family protein [Pseudonocardia cypriaca]
MTVERAMRMLRERWGIAVLCVLLGLLGAGVATYLTPRAYSSDVTLFVSLQGRAESSDDAYQADRLAQARVQSYVPLLTDERITQPVIDRLALAMTPAELASRITVTVEPESTVLTAAVRDATPDGAAAIANAVAAEFVGLVGELEQPIGPAPPPPPPGQPAQESTRIGVQVVRPAVAQPAPVSPDVPFNLALGGALGLLIGIAAMVVRDMRDTSVRSAADVEELAEVPVLAEIAHDRRVPTRPLLVDDPFGSPRAEAFRKLRTNLQFLNGVRGRGVIVVTSARVGEGTSTTACNLAITLAEAGNRVLLVDANLRDPGVADYLGVDSIPGLVDVLAGRMVWPYARKPWNRGGFDVLPAGSVAQDHSQLLSSFGLADLLADMRNHYHFIVVDTPALLPVSDAAAVAARADGVVLVVQHRQTSKEQVAAAVAALRSVSARLLGTVLTMRRGRPGPDARLPSYRTPPPPPRRDLPPVPMPVRPEITSPPLGIPQAIPEQGTNGKSHGGDPEPAAGHADGSTRRPSPTPRS